MRRRDKLTVVDLSYTPEDEAYRRKVRDWFARNHPGSLETHEQRRAWHRKLYEAGFIGMGWPKEYGGQAARPMEQAIVGEEMARLGVPGGVNGLGIGFIGPTLIVHGTEDQKRRYIPRILSAEEIWCQLYSEPNAGSDLAGLRTQALRESFDKPGPSGGLRRAPGANRSGRAQAQGHLVLHPGYALTWSGGAAAQADHGQRRIQRSLLDQHQGAD